MTGLQRSLAPLGLLAGAALLLMACESPEPAPPPVLLVVMDTVRADRTSTYGYARPTTIQLDAVARAGVVFEDVTAPGSWTWPSHASLFTGRPPWEHGAHLVTREQAASLARNAVVEGSEVMVGRMRTDLPTLAERFAEAGYRTRALFSNEWLAADLGLTPAASKRPPCSKTTMRPGGRPCARSTIPTHALSCSS
jgi:arylsulfatase A-like enzyme